MSPTFTYDDVAFRTALPYFADVVKYPPLTMEQNFVNGTNFVSNYNYGWLCGSDRQFALYLITAHIATLNDIIMENDGGTAGVVRSARIDKISVVLVPPPSKNQFCWWLNQTPWGQQLATLLAVKSAGGWQVGGIPERAAFRRAGGGFGGFR